MITGVAAIVVAILIIAADNPKIEEPPRANPQTFTPVWEAPEPVSREITPNTYERIIPDLEPTQSITEAPESESPPIPAVPKHMSIPAIDVNHSVVNVGLLSDGTMEIPDDVNKLGWYEPGIKPGELGSAVIAGHVDSRTQGKGVFFDLRLLETDDMIKITDAQDIVRTWIITDITRFDKNDTPMDEIFRWEGDSEDLVLVTCGGEFDQTRRSYKDNIVVYASPVT